MTGTARTASPSSSSRTPSVLEHGTGMTGTVTMKLEPFAKRRLFNSYECEILLFDETNTKL